LALPDGGGVARQGLAPPGLLRGGSTEARPTRTAAGRLDGVSPHRTAAVAARQSLAPPHCGGVARQSLAPPHCGGVARQRLCGSRGAGVRARDPEGDIVKAFR
ncbi:MAG: hypothetical protein ACR2OZ_11365, partial [Verrucomicrobiales bacterium]